MATEFDDIELRSHGASAFTVVAENNGTSLRGPICCANCGMVYADVMRNDVSVYRFICIGGRDNGSLPPPCVTCRGPGIATGVAACYYGDHDRVECIRKYVKGLLYLQNLQINTRD